MRKHEATPIWGTLYKITGQYSYVKVMKDKDLGTLTDWKRPKEIYNN